MRDAFVAGTLAFAWLAIGASPAHFWLDSGELSAAGWELGVAHPPGTPGLTLLLRLATIVPIGSLGFRMALVSAALGAVAVAMTVAILQRRGTARPLRYGAALWIVAGLTFARQGRVVEIYALAGALTMVALWGLDPAVGGRLRTSRRLLGIFAAVWAVWCFGDLRLALAPLVIVLWLAQLRSDRAWTRWAPLVVATASLVVLALPLASAAGPVADWGDPQTMDRLVDHVLARSITDAFADEILPRSLGLWQLNATAAIGRLAEDLGAPGLVAFVVALGRVWWTGPRRVAAALTWIVAIELLYAIGINPMGGADRQTGLVLGPIAALVVAHQLGEALGERPWVRFGAWPLVGTVLVLPAMLSSAPDLARTRSWGPHAWCRGALAQLPPGATLLTQSDDLSAAVAAARALEGARPDVVTAPAQHLHKSPPEAALEDPRAAKLRRAAASAGGEASAVRAAIAASPGPVALEHAGIEVLAGIRPAGSRGELPLVIVGDHPPPPRSIPDQVQAWSTRLPTDEDRRRLAVALASEARAQVQLRGDVARGIALLELSLSRVDPDHASALVALGALMHGIGRRDEAIALTRRALALDPGRSVALTNLARYLAADPTTADEALALAEQAASLRPWRQDVWVRLAEVRTSRGDLAGAAEAAARARTLAQ